MTVRDLLKTVKGLLSGWRSIVVIIALLALRPAMAADGSAPAPIPDSLQQRMAACIACHGDHGEAADTRFFSRLAGKPASFLARQLHYFQSGQRKCAPMQYTIYPPLDCNASVTEPVGVNATRVLLLGGFSPATAANPRPYSMPPFTQQLSDAEVSAVVSYIRQTWSNRAPVVQECDVSRYLTTPVD